MTLTLRARLRLGFISAAALWTVGCSVGVLAGIVCSPDGLSSSTGTMDLISATSTWEILRVNSFVLALAVLGLFSFGITALLTVTYSGLVFGAVAGAAYRSGLDWGDVILATAPHSIEIPALWLAAAVGLLGPGCIRQFLGGGSFLPDQTSMVVPLALLSALALTVIAAFLESKVSIGILAG